MGYYYCGEKGCKGHETYSESCSSMVRDVPDYEPLHIFQEMAGAEEDTQEVVTLDLANAPRPAQVETPTAVKVLVSPKAKANKPNDPGKIVKIRR